MDVKWEEIASEWIAEPIDDLCGCIGAKFGPLPESRQADFESQRIQQRVKEEMKDLLYGFKKGPKRKACPSWSVPNEVLLMALAPAFCSVRETSRRGIGEASLADVQEEDFAACRALQGP